MSDQQAHFDQIAERIAARLEVPVKISLGRLSGQVVLTFHTSADLERIVEQIELNLDDENLA